MKLVIGLGNPGRQYEYTRHNVGFWAAERLARKLGTGFQQKKQFKAEISEGRLGSEQIIIIRPQTYMNLSGLAVASITGFYKLDTADMIVVHDDLDLPVGRIRLRKGGSAGGHNGIKSIIERIGSDEFIRVKIGIGRPPMNIPVVDYVLQRSQPEDEKVLSEQCDKAVDAICTIIIDGLNAGMNKFNGLSK